MSRVRALSLSKGPSSGALPALLLLVTLLLTSCAPAPAPPPAPPTPPPISSTAELAAQKKAAGIEDCPPSDAAVAPVDGGLPDVTLPCLGGGRHVRLAGLRGRPMMINIWAQWCEPCRAESRFLSETARVADPDELMIMGVDYSDPRPDYAIEFAELVKWQYPQLADPDLSLRAPLQIAGPPQTLFVRADGEIAYRHSGPFRSTAEITTLLQRHLGVDDQ